MNGLNSKNTLMKITTKIIVQLQVEGLHNWPNVNINEVGFLKNIHRHVFFILIEKKVSHDDRDIEIIEFKRDIFDYLYGKYYSHSKRCFNFFEMSCESIAKEILNKFNCSLVRVLEDNENGAIVYINQ